MTQRSKPTDVRIVQKPANRKPYRKPAVSVTQPPRERNAVLGTACAKPDEGSCGAGPYAL
jgi:hypothetical protein